MTSISFLATKADSLFNECPECEEKLPAGTPMIQIDGEYAGFSGVWHLCLSHAIKAATELIKETNKL